MGDGNLNFYRVKQFYWSITSKIDEKGLEYVKNNLNAKEYKLFLRLSKQEQYHSMKVAKDVEQECLKLKIESKELIMIALLHDIGKIYKKLNVFDKSIMVLADKITSGKIRNIKHSKKTEVYFNHGIIGYELLKNSGINERALYLIKNHHNDRIKDDMELNILRKCDGNN